jgi:hypothetical protein
MGMLAVAVLAVSVSAGPTSVLLSEDFEQYGAPSLVNDATGWASDSGMEINNKAVDSIEGHGLNSGKAFDGNSHNEVGNPNAPSNGRIWATSRLNIPDRSDAALTFTVEFDAIVRSNGHNAGTANAGVYLECDDCGPGSSEFGMHYARHNTTGWGFNGPSGMNRVAGSSPGWYANEPVRISMTLDKASMTASATISEIDGTAGDIAVGNHGVGVFATQAISQSIWEGITKLRVRNDVYNYGDNRGIDLDNIVISESFVPEPATMGLALLTLCGLAVIRRKR